MRLLDQTNLSRIINTAYITLMLGLGMLLYFWFADNEANDRRVAFVVQENREVYVLSNLSKRTDAVRSALYRALIDDKATFPEQILAELSPLAEQIHTITDNAESDNFDLEEKALWHGLHPLIHRFLDETAAVAASLRGGQRDRALLLLRDSIEPLYIEMQQATTKLAHNQSARIDTNLAMAAEQTDGTGRYFLGIAASLIVVTLLIQMLTKHTDRVDAQLRDHGERIRALFDISATPGLTVEQQIAETLRLGRRIFGTPIAKVSRIDIDANINETTFVVAPEEIRTQLQGTFALSDTLCGIIGAHERPVAISHIGISELRNHAGYVRSGIECYIAAPIYVNDALYGTVAFADVKPHGRPYTADAIEFITLLGKWISTSIERKQAQDATAEKQHAVAASQAKSSFLANMSHEIRTPLTAIIGFAEAASEPDQSDAARTEALTTIARSGHNLLQIINDILDLSKVEAGKLDIERIPMSIIDVVNDVRTMIKPHACAKGLAFDVNFRLPLPKVVVSDPVRLRQVLLNLAGNAVKFTPQGHVRIDVTFNADDDRIVIDVIDSGIGLTKEQQQKLFQAFTQADSSTTRRYGGTGLGLSLSRQFVELLGGTINVASEPDAGSQFSVSIPAGFKVGDALITSSDHLSSTPTAAPAHPVPARMRGRVLVVEDIAENQKLIGLLLSRLGIEIDYADNGQEAVDLLAQSGANYDLILMDMQMPVMDGLTAIRELRLRGNATPIVALTANAMQDDVKTAVDAGASAHLAKPIDRPLFYRVIGQYLHAADDDAPSSNAGEPLTPITSTLLLEDPECTDLVEKYVASLPDAIRQLDAACAKLDWKNVAAQLHSLKGSGGNFGYHDLSRLAAAMESALRDNDHAQLASLRQRLNGMCQRIVCGMTA